MAADGSSDTARPQGQAVSYTIGHLRERLAEDPRTSELDVDVEIVGDRVFLTGSVTSVERKGAITELVRDSLPGHDVCNEMSVTSIRERPDPEELS